MQIEVQTLGVFRSLAPSFVVEVTGPPSVGAVRDALALQLAETAPHLLDTLVRSAFATEDMVLRDSDPLDTSAPLAILPPVAGG